MRINFRENVFTEPLPSNGHLFIRLLQSKGYSRLLFRGLCLAASLIRHSMNVCMSLCLLACLPIYVAI
jgi:hypothetical protein